METKQIQALIEKLNFTAVMIQNSKDNEQKELKESAMALIEKMKLDLLTKLYSMETKQIKIEVPQGYEIDREKSTLENIILKPIEVKLPLSVEEIPDRRYCIDNRGNIYEIKKFDKTGCTDINNLSTENRAKAFLALMQLVELRDAWNEGWKPDWNYNDNKYCIFFYRNKLEKCVMSNESIPLHFKTLELAEKFAEQFKDLINEAKELL